MANYVGVYGMGVMGQSLALNIAHHGYQVAVFNHFPDETKNFAASRAQNEKLVHPTYDLREFLDSLEAPRKIILMVKAGDVVDSVTDELAEYLEPGDIVIDGGNSYYADTEMRMEKYAKKQIVFFGMGVSGGEKGALEGPSIMPSGNREIYTRYLEKMLATIAAHTQDGSSCCEYIGSGGSGHYVKMVHNGIEYGDIQIINEAYFLLKQLCHLSNPEIADIFERWNEGKLKSYLVEISSKILREKDPLSGNDLVDMILDEAGQKGTGMWTAIEALNKHVVAPTMTEAVFARNLSALKDQRIVASQQFKKNTLPSTIDVETFIQDLEHAVYASKIMSYAQGFDLLKEASACNNWDLKLGNIALLWREGCIIRAVFLDRIKSAYDEGEVVNLMLTREFRNEIQEALESWRRVVSTSIASGVCIPTLANSLIYFDGYTTERLPANLCQAQRDWFGAHTFRRIDKPRDESFHHKWENF